MEINYKVFKLKTQFHSVSAWHLMESAAALMPPSTGLNCPLLYAETKYSRRNRIWNYNTLSMYGGSLIQYKDSWCEIQVLWSKNLPK